MRRQSPDDRQTKRAEHPHSKETNRSNSPATMRSSVDHETFLIESEFGRGPRIEMLSKMRRKLTFSRSLRKLHFFNETCACREELSLRQSILSGDRHSWELTQTALSCQMVSDNRQDLENQTQNAPRRTCATCTINIFSLILPLKLGWGKHQIHNTPEFRIRSANQSIPHELLCHSLPAGRPLPAPRAGRHRRSLVPPLLAQ